MDNRFNASNILVLKGVAACSPSSSVFLQYQELKLLSMMYGIDVSSLDMELQLLSRAIASLREGESIQTISQLGLYLHSCLPAYNSIYKTVQIALTIAVTSAECERSFSALKRIKTHVRTLWVTNACWIAIERNIASSMIDYDTIINDFAASDNNRQLTLF